MTQHQKDSKSAFCIMPWVHLYVAQNGNVTPCCQAPPQKVHRFGNVNKQSIQEIWNGENIEAFRKKMLAGEKDVRCKQCYTKEEQGIASMREATNKKYVEKVDTVIHSTNKIDSTPIYFDIRFSNACNLKCRICGPWASSQWHKDAVALGMRKKGESPTSFAIQDETVFFEELTPFLSTAKEFYFAGGEPLMMEQHYKVLSALIECGNTEIQLDYNTNFSTLKYKEHSVIDYWKHFSKVNVSASLDAEGERGELLRKNLKWDKVIANRKVLLEEVPHVSFQITPTVCVFNVAHLPAFHQQWVDEGLIGVEDFIPNLLIHPKEYQINLLPLVTQIELKTDYQAHVQWMLKQVIHNKERFNEALFRFNNIIDLLGVNFSTKLQKVLTEKTEQLDELRKEKSTDVFPELKQLFK